MLQIYRERGLPVEQAVHKMTGLAAGIVGLKDRGVLRVGAVADIVVFDPATVRDNATWTMPNDGAVRHRNGDAGGACRASITVVEGPLCGRVLRKGLPSL